MRIAAMTLLAALTGCTRPAVVPVRAPQEAARPAPNPQEQDAPVAVVLVIDRSGSMTGPKGEAARAAAKASLRTLSGESLFGLISFAAEAKTEVPLQPARRRESLELQIDKIAFRGGTDIREGLRMAQGALLGADAARNQSPYQGVAELAEAMKQDGITISCVGIGDFDAELLELIATTGGGRIHAADALDDLPRLFALETRNFLENSQSGRHAR